MADNAPGAVHRALLAAHAQAAQYPTRTGAIINGGAMAATRNSGAPLGLHNVSAAHSIHISKARSSGTEASALDRTAHLQDRHIPLKDRASQ